MNYNKLVPELKFKVGRDKKYEIKTIQDNAVYVNTN